MDSVINTAVKVYEELASMGWAAEGTRPGGLALTRRSFELAELSPGSTMVDLGCGAGASLEYVRLNHADINAFGLDKSEKMLGLSSEMTSSDSLIRGDFHELPFRDDSLDAVLVECSLSLVSYSNAVMAELNRILKKGGKLIVTDVYLRQFPEIELGDSIGSECCFKGAKSKDQILDLLEQSGFGISVWEDHSRILKDFAVRLILMYGSMELFWRQMLADCDGLQVFEQSMRKAKPGYYMLLASKTDSFRRNGPAQGHK